MSICKKEDFHYSSNTNVLLKYLPTTIPFDPKLYQQFHEKHITVEWLTKELDVALWVCNENKNMDLWELLKPTVHSILQSAIEKSNLVSSPGTIIHFRCADTPFIKHQSYRLQHYSFFKYCLELIHPINKRVVLMNCSTHLSGKEEQKSCSEYIERLSSYLNSLGYRVEKQCKTNGEDFADLFQAEAVISTGGSFSFMSGFFGKGKFLSAEHTIDDRICDRPKCLDTFMKGYNIPHENVESYHDIDDVYALLTKSIGRSK
jgi:hypothetical protein